MNLLFVHQNFPGQYHHLLKALCKEEKHTIVGLGLNEPSSAIPQGVIYRQYPLNQKNTENIDQLIIETETKILRGKACAEAAFKLKQDGFKPDLICVHTGWGEASFLKDIWPECPILGYQEFWYNIKGFDYNFDPEFKQELNWEKASHIRMKNCAAHLSFEASDWNVTPTQFQYSSFPKEWQNKISIIHDGIDTKLARPNNNPRPLVLDSGLTLTPDIPIITYVNRALEPFRGCHSLIRAIPTIQKYIPKALLIIAGNPLGPTYGKSLKGKSWASHFMKEIEGKYDRNKVHFVGTLPYHLYIKLLQQSSAHIYLTYPFVLSWSLLEAMSIGCSIIGSDTKPVQEIIKDGYNGILCNFFDSSKLGELVAEIIQNKELSQKLGFNARQTILNNYSLEKCIPKQIKLIKTLSSYGPKL